MSLALRIVLVSCFSRFFQNSTPKIPNGKRRQQLRDRYKCSEGVPKKKIVLYDLTDDEAVEGANSSESEDIEGENQ